MLGLERSTRVSATLVALQDTTAEIRVRGAFLLLALFVALAESFGLEAILGAFLAGATLRLVDRDAGDDAPVFHHKLEAAGFGVFIPFFFVTTGIGSTCGARRQRLGARARAALPRRAAARPRRCPRCSTGRSRGRDQWSPAGCCRRRRSASSVVGGQIGVELGLLAATTYRAGRRRAPVRDPVPAARAAAPARRCAGRARRQTRRPVRRRRTGLTPARRRRPARRLGSWRAVSCGSTGAFGRTIPRAAPATWHGPRASGAVRAPFVNPPTARRSARRWPRRLARRTASAAGLPSRAERRHLH